MSVVTAPQVTGAQIQGSIALNARLQEARGATDVSSAASNITLGTDGNFFNITLAGTINMIDSAGWQSGSIVTLKFASTPTFTNNGAAASGTFLPMLLNSAASYVGAAGGTLTLILDLVGGFWMEIGRKV